MVKLGPKTADMRGTLTLRELSPGRFSLTGYINGKQVRKVGRSLVEMEALKAKLEGKSLEATLRVTGLNQLPPSRITLEQLRDAEVAVGLLGDSLLTLVECVRVGMATLGDGKPTSWRSALAAYIGHKDPSGTWVGGEMREKEVTEKHIHETRRQLEAFFEASGIETLGEVSARTIASFVFRDGVANATRVANATAIRGFFNFTLTHKMLQSSPFAVDMDQLKTRAIRSRERPRLLTGAQAKKLLEETIAEQGGQYVPHVILGLWGGIRPAEVERLDIRDLFLDGPKPYVRIDPVKCKTAAFREVYLPENMVPLLKECITSGFIDESPLGPLPRCGWADIRARAGLIELGKDKTWGTRLVENTVWQQDILRHTGLSYYFKKTGNVQEVARQAGHSTDISFKHYLNLATEADTTAFYQVRLSLNPEAPAASVA